MKHFCVVCALMCAAGCTDNDTGKAAVSADLNGCVRSAIDLANLWMERVTRWVRPEQVHRFAFRESDLVDTAARFATNTLPTINCVSPLFVKFERSMRVKSRVDDGRLIDLRGNADGRFAIEALAFGSRTEMTGNRLYFILNNGNVSTAWVRRFDNLLEGMGCYPQVQCIDGDPAAMGLFEIRWSGIAPIFIGEDGYDLECFLRLVTSGDARLYWGSGRFGLHEGKHVYEAERLARWIECFSDSIVPLRVVFAANDTYVFSVGGPDAKAQK